MIVNKACRYRLYPTTEQKMMFAKTFGCVRFIYNKMLSDRLDYYKETGKKLHNTPAQYKEEFPWLKEVDSLALANAQMNLNKAYHNILSNRNDNGWNLFTNMLEYKLAWQGKQLIKTDKWYPSSQLCHVCGYQNHETKDLSVREWDCPKCGSHHNRDKNAAINIREEARRISA